MTDTIQIDEAFTSEPVGPNPDFDVDTTALTPPPAALTSANETGTKGIQGPGPEPKKERKRWTDGNRKHANPAGKWLVLGPYTPRYNDDPNMMTTSKTLIRGGGRQDNGVWSGGSLYDGVRTNNPRLKFLAWKDGIKALNRGEPNTKDPDPRNPKVMQSDIVDHGFRANRHARRAS